jgi:hypothetical protein
MTRKADVKKCRKNNNCVNVTPKRQSTPIIQHWPELLFLMVLNSNLHFQRNSCDVWGWGG